MIKHISLDFWNTVGVVNPEYSRLRTLALSRMFLTDERTAAKTYIKIKNIVDGEDETIGRFKSRYEDFHRLINGFSSGLYLQYLSEELMKQFDRLFIKHPPIIHSDTISAIRMARDRGITVSISSNTHFIMGDLIRPVLGDLVDFCIFSDEIIYTKPSRMFFSRVHEAINHFKAPVEKGEVVHIGDSLVCDYQGASEFGFGAILVDGTGETANAIEHAIGDESSASNALGSQLHE